MKKGDVVRVTSNSVPHGLVPSYNARLLWQYSPEKWYALKTDEEHKWIADSSKIFLLKPEYKN